MRLLDKIRCLRGFKSLNEDGMHFSVKCRAEMKRKKGRLRAFKMASQNGLYYPRGIKVFFLPKAAAKAEVLLFSTVNKIMPTGVETRARKAIYEMHTSITSLKKFIITFVLLKKCRMSKQVLIISLIKVLPPNCT